MNRFSEFAPAAETAIPAARLERRDQKQRQINDAVRRVRISRPLMPGRAFAVVLPLAANRKTHDMHLFIYGTLKRGQCRSHFMQGQRFLGEARTLPKYRLYDCGGYPGLVCAANGISVVGELWRIERGHVDVLDAVEGVSENLFRRGQVELEQPFDGRKAWTYFYQQSVIGLCDCGERW